MRYPVVTFSVLILSATFATAQSGFTTEYYPAALSSSQKAGKLLSADLNGDGFPDLIAYDGATSVFYNNGDGGYGPAQPIASGTTFNAVTVADMNGDSFPDIVGCQSTNPTGEYLETITVLLNDGNGNFTAQTPVTTPGQCSVITTGDVYGTGNSAVITGGNEAGQYGPSGEFYPGNTVSIDVFQNDGTGQVTAGEQSSGSFGQPNSTTDYTNCAFVDLVGGNFRQTGTYDLVITTSCQPSNGATNEGTIYYAAGGTASSPGYSTYTYLQSVAGSYSNGRAVDLNGDGRLDLLFTNTTTSGASLVTGLNSGSGTFVFTNYSGSAATTIGEDDAADFNQDGKIDLVDTSSTGTSSAPAASLLNIYNGTVSGSYTLSQSITTSSSASTPEGVLAADLNRDGRPDIATLVTNAKTGATSLLVYLNTQANGSVCVAPSTTNTNVICTPDSGADISSGSPVIVSAASNVPKFTLNRVYVDNQAIYQTASQTVSTSISAGNGSHDLVLVSYNSLGQAFTSSSNFTVGEANGSSCLPDAAGVAICEPSNEGTYPAQFSITAGAKAKTGYITALRVYVDNDAVYTTDNPDQTATYDFTTNLSLAGGTHNIVVVGYESTGAALTNSVQVTVPPPSCTPTASGTSICSPAQGAMVGSFVDFAATAYSSTSLITGMAIYIDNQQYSVSYPSPQGETQYMYINQGLSVASGKHTLLVVGYTNGGSNVYSPTQTFTVQ